MVEVGAGGADSRMLQATLLVPIERSTLLYLFGGTDSGLGINMWKTRCEDMQDLVLLGESSWIIGLCV